MANAGRHSGSPVPLTILTGFLGAGKTTLLNSLLRDPAFAGTAVIVNEFGEIGLDHLLVESAADGIVELSAGCVCCSVRGELVEALERLLKSMDNRRVGQIGRVVIETTGLAEPGPILAVLLAHPDLRLGYRLAGTVTVVDAVNGEKTLENHEEAVAQVAAADRIVLTKTSPANGQEALLARLRELAPGTPILDAAKGEASAAALIIQPVSEPAARISSHETAAHHAHASSVAVSAAIETDEASLEVFLDLLRSRFADQLLRVKGLVGIAGGGPALVHGVQGIYAPPTRLDAWPDNDHRTRMVFIGRHLDREGIEALFSGFFGIARADTPDRTALTENPLSVAGFTPSR